jgi:2-dehydro-3-deoxygluconokinase
MGELINYVDVGIANEEDCQHTLDLKIDQQSWKEDIKSGELNLEKYKSLCEEVLEKYPNLKMQAITLRHSFSADHNGWSGCLHDRKEFFVGLYYVYN